VTDGGTAQTGAGDGGADLLDVVDEHVGLKTRASIGLGPGDRVTVHVLAANGDTDNILAEVVAVGADGSFESSKLVGHVAAGSPETQQKGGVLSNGGGNSLDRVLAGTALDHGVETSTGEARGANEVLGGLKLGLEVGLVLAAAIDLGGAVVEALVGGLGSRQRHGEGENLLREHCGN